MFETDPEVADRLCYMIFSVLLADDRHRPLEIIEYFENHGLQRQKLYKRYLHYGAFAFLDDRFAQPYFQDMSRYRTNLFFLDYFRKYSTPSFHMFLDWKLQ